MRAQGREDVIGGRASELRLPAQVSELGAARDYVQRAGAAFGLDADGCYELAFAVNEAVTNAIRHGRPDEHGNIHLSILEKGEQLTLSVRDYGTFVASDAVHADPEGGRGFLLMARLTDAVQLCVAPGSTTVCLSKARA